MAPEACLFARMIVAATLPLGLAAPVAAADSPLAGNQFMFRAALKKAFLKGELAVSADGRTIGPVLFERKPEPMHISLPCKDPQGYSYLVNRSWTMFAMRIRDGRFTLRQHKHALVLAVDGSFPAAAPGSRLMLLLSMNEGPVSSPRLLSVRVLTP